MCHVITVEIFMHSIGDLTYNKLLGIIKYKNEAHEISSLPHEKEK